MSSTQYRAASQFIVRMTGFPIEDLQPLCSEQLATAIDRLSSSNETVESMTERLLAQLRDGGAATRAQRRQIKRRVPLEAMDGVDPVDLRAYNLALADEARANEELLALYASEHERARRHLYDVVSTDKFHQMLLVSSPELERLTPTTKGAPPERNSQIRQREFTWISYLQRITTKNETVSIFGPCVWGRAVEHEPKAVDIDLREGVAERKVYVERWVPEALAAKMVEDPAVQPLLRPRPADDLVLEDGRAVLVTDDRALEITADERLVIERSDGTRRVAELGNPALIRRLVEQRLLDLRLRVPMNSSPLHRLRVEVESWPSGEARERWEPRLAEIERLRGEFERNETTDSRRGPLAQMQAALAEWGVTAAQNRSQTLYASRLPFNESCRKAAARVVLGQPFVEQITSDLAPWYELWRDLAGLYATQICESIRPVWDSLAKPVSLSRFIAACTKAGLPIDREAGTGLLPGLEPKIQQAWQEQLGPRMAEREVLLTSEDLAFVRRQFPLRRMKAFDNPAPDLQILAPSQEAANAGDLEILVAEIHPDYVTWEQVFAAQCPDVDAYVDDYHRSRRPPGVVFGRRALSEHICNRAYEQTRGWSSLGDCYLEGLPSFRSAEVFVEMNEDDIYVRDASGRSLGSLLHTWEIALNTHQLLLLGTSSHTPRLRVGRVLVQRESWLVDSDDDLRDSVQRGGAYAMAAFRRFRARHGLPEEVFVSPRLPVRMSFHKDAKPMFVDFRSPLLLEVLASLVKRFRRLRITELLPTTKDFWLADGTGHFSSELRITVRPVNADE